MLRRLVFLGPPGAGKGTQAAISSRLLKVPSIATGSIFREAISQGTGLGREISQFVHAGLLVPDKLTNAIVTERLKKPDCADGFLLDGYPRNVAQAQAFDTFLKKRNHSLEKALYFKVDASVVVARLGDRRVCSKCETNYNLLTRPPKTPGICDLCGGELFTRIDDQPQSITRRLEIYVANLQPLLDYYQKQGILSVLDASQPVEKVSADFAKLVGM